MEIVATSVNSITGPRVVFTSSLRVTRDIEKSGVNLKVTHSEDVRKHPQSQSTHKKTRIILNRPTELLSSLMLGSQTFTELVKLDN